MIDDINDSIEERAAQAQNYTDALVSQWVDLMLKFPISTIVVSFLLAGIMWNISKKYYTNKLINYCKKENPDIVEIHNRPSYLNNIYKEFNNTNFILIIHNDPLNLKGSITVNERLDLLNKCYKIYFVSTWVEEKFFTGIDKNFYTNFKSTINFT